MEASVQGQGSESVIVTVDGEELEFTGTAAEAFTRNNEEVDILDPNSYDGLTGGQETLLEQIRNDLNSSSTIEGLTQVSGDRDLENPDIRPQ
ncbi:hypothetical protein [Halorubrum distributum]|uniref:hypothetical protein n=1 Tax=Halorubrum distributum TaxID=29283 RepID=UPI0012696A76|nr:hypothetical protein [Halorubrum arcis]